MDSIQYYGFISNGIMTFAYLGAGGLFIYLTAKVNIEGKREEDKQNKLEQTCKSPTS